MPIFIGFYLLARDKFALTFFTQFILADVAILKFSFLLNLV